MFYPLQVSNYRQELSRAEGPQAFLNVLGRDLAPQIRTGRPQGPRGLKRAKRAQSR